MKGQSYNCTIYDDPFLEKTDKEKAIQAQKMKKWHKIIFPKGIETLILKHGSLSAPRK